MAFQHFHHLLFFIFFLFLICISPIIGDAKRENMPGDKTPSRFALDFIKQLEGSKKGNKIEGIHHVKNYLHQFGYLQTLTQDHVDEFDEALESAIKTYQQNYHITPTGTLDAATVSKMTTPRCGVPDIINGRNTMQPERGNIDNNSSTSDDIHTVSHYTFFRGDPKWPKFHLTYEFFNEFYITPDKAKTPIVRAFQKWHSVSPFNFSQTEGFSKADLIIGFYRGAHGDGSPFDGVGGTLAHAFAPTDGRLHFDVDERWGVPAVGRRQIDLETVALHEIGHLLGLSHSSVKSAVMYPSVSEGEIKTVFDADDINGIKALYES